METWRLKSKKGKVPTASGTEEGPSWQTGVGLQDGLVVAHASEWGVRSCQEASS